MPTPFQYLTKPQELHAWAQNLVRRLNTELPAPKVPAGAIVQYGGTTAPTGWLACDGATTSKAAYPELFNVIGYTHGGSDDDFTLPLVEGGFFIIKA